VAAFLEELFRMRLLEIAGADLARWDLRGDGENGHAGAMTVEQAIDEMQITGSATARADRKITSEVGVRARREGRDFLMPDMDPFDLALATDHIGQAVEAVPDDAVNPFDSGCYERFRELFRHCSRHGFLAK
jgi:hypothetical protein